MKKRSPLHTAGFTLVEIIVAVTIIGLLAAIAVPAYMKLTEKSTNTLMNNELRVASGALNYYAFEHGRWPPDGAGGWPSELIGYLPPPDRWHKTTPIGGKWAWSTESDEAAAALRINNFTASSTQITNLDRMSDDGDLATGSLLVAGVALVYVMER